MARRPECEQLLTELSEYLDGTAQEELCAQIERHLAECDDCTVVLNTIQKTVLLYRQVEARTELSSEVRRRL
ncbi:MAG: zf-HC2 domain-containing protein [Chloroflexota bacterium]